MAIRNLPSMPEITDAFLNELVGDIINDVEDETEYIPITTNLDDYNDERKDEQPEHQLPFTIYNEAPISTYSQSTRNNFKLQNSETNITTTEHTNGDKLISNVGSKTMQKWLTGDQLIVHPVWIGNLPPDTTTAQLRNFVQLYVGRVTVSIHINNNVGNNQQKTYAFVNLPSAEKQMLVITLLDNTMWNNCKLMVRPNKPVKFQQASFFGGGSSRISQQHFQRFQDTVVPVILNGDINAASVSKILQTNGININDLPNRVFGKQCTLIPNCHRTYCSFYHCEKQKELGRIISILSRQNITLTILQQSPLKVNNMNTNTIKSRHTLLVQGLVQNKRQKIEEMFDVFGDVDTVMVSGNNMCYVRMKHPQDAQKIVHLFKSNRNGVCIDFASYQNQRLQLEPQSISEPLGQQTYSRNAQWNNSQRIRYQNQRQIGYGYGYGYGSNGNHLSLRNAYSDVQYSQTIPSQNNGSGYKSYDIMVDRNDNPTNKQ